MHRDGYHRVLADGAETFRSGRRIDGNFAILGGKRCGIQGVASHALSDV